MQVNLWNWKSLFSAFSVHVSYQHKIWASLLISNNACLAVHDMVTFFHHWQITNTYIQTKHRRICTRWLKMIECRICTRCLKIIECRICTRWLKIIECCICTRWLKIIECRMDNMGHAFEKIESCLNNNFNLTNQNISHLTYTWPYTCWYIELGWYEDVWKTTPYLPKRVFFVLNDFCYHLQTTYIHTHTCRQNSNSLIRGPSHVTWVCTLRGLDVVKVLFICETGRRKDIVCVFLFLFSTTQWGI